MLDPNTLATLLILSSAVLHATWNGAVKRADNKLAIMVFISGFGGFLYLPLIPFFPLPDMTLWLFIAASIVVHLVYQLTLTRALEVGDLTYVYPIARGMGPLLVAIFSLFFLAGELEPIETIAVFVLVSGIFLTIGSRPGAGFGLVAAIVTGLMIATYTLIDGFAVKAAASAMTYVIWSEIVFAPVFLAYALTTQQKGFLLQSLNAWPRGLPATIMAKGGYAMALYAFSLGSIAEVAALRETSIIFATLIGIFWLKEQVSRRQICAILLIASGAMALKIF